MSVSIKCVKCGQLALFNTDKDYKTVSKIVDNHKAIEGNNKHRVRVKRY